MITKNQLAIITNSICSDSSGESRSAKHELADKLFPGDKIAIQDAICNHPIELNWDDYLKSTNKEKFLLPENT